MNKNEQIYINKFDDKNNMKNQWFFIKKLSKSHIIIKLLR